MCRAAAAPTSSPSRRRPCSSRSAPVNGGCCASPGVPARAASPVPLPAAAGCSSSSGEPSTEGAARCSRRSCAAKAPRASRLYAASHSIRAWSSDKPPPAPLEPAAPCGATVAIGVAPVGADAEACRSGGSVTFPSPMATAAGGPGLDTRWIQRGWDVGDARGWAPSAGAARVGVLEGGWARAGRSAVGESEAAGWKAVAETGGVALLCWWCGGRAARGGGCTLRGGGERRTRTVGAGGAGAGGAAPCGAACMQSGGSCGGGEVRRALCSLPSAPCACSPGDASAPATAEGVGDGLLSSLPPCALTPALVAVVAASAGWAWRRSSGWLPQRSSVTGRSATGGRDASRKSASCGGTRWAQLLKASAARALDVTLHMETKLPRSAHQGLCGGVGVGLGGALLAGRGPGGRGGGRRALLRLLPYEPAVANAAGVAQRLPALRAEPALRRAGDTAFGAAPLSAGAAAGCGFDGGDEVFQGRAC